jgi:sigma-B regulation protein RsbU (phosphoserine phosphatase)
MSSLAKQLTFRIMAVVLVMMAVITCRVYFTVRAYMLTEAQECYEGALLRDHEEFRRRLSDVMVATKNNVHNIEQDIDDPEKITAHLERILRVNPTILTCAVRYKPDYFPGKPRCLELYASRDSAGVVHLGKVENDNNIYEDRNWFRKCLAEDTASWSEVYYEYDLIPHVSGRRQLTTYYVHVHDKQGHPMAVFSSDLPLEYLRKEMMNDLQALNEEHEQGNKHHAFNFVINQKGTYLIHPDERRILNDNFFQESRLTTNTIDDDIVASMRNGEKGSAMVEIDRVPS